MCSRVDKGDDVCAVSLDHRSQLPSAELFSMGDLIQGVLAIQIRQESRDKRAIDFSLKARTLKTKD